MTPLLKAALTGTAQRSPSPLDSERAVDSLLLQRQDDSPEKLLLLNAGATFLREMAGRQTDSVPELEAAPADEGHVPSPQLEQLLASVLTPDSIPLLPEFAAMMQEFRIQLPHGLLPAILDFQDEMRREMLRPLLGNRSRWLAQFNPAWSWALELEDPEEQAARFKSQFDDGTAPERLAAFRDIRRLNPQLGRELLQGDLHLEKGDQKRKLVQLLCIGLHPDDEPLLEALRSDRSGKIRELANSFLSQLPDSKLTARMKSRGAECLTLIESAPGGELQVTLPDKFPESWDEDGITEDSPPGIGKKGWWIQSLVARIPLDFWPQHFQRSPTELIRLAGGHDEFIPIFTGWIDSLVRFTPRVPVGKDWTAPLWDVIVQRRWGRGEDQTLMFASASQLLKNIPGEAVDSSLTVLLQQAGDITDFPVEEWLPLAPRPWSESLSRTYLTTARKLLMSRSDPRVVRWGQTFFPAALGLSPTLFSQALEPWSLNADRSGVWKTIPIESILQRFGEVIRVRARFQDEVMSLSSSGETDVDQFTQPV